MTAVQRDPVRVEPRRIYASVEMDVYPRRLNKDGQERVIGLVQDAIKETLALATPGRKRECRWYGTGPSGCYVNGIDKQVASELAAELRCIASDPDCVEEVTWR
jgi:hypothetical protein